MILQCNGFPQQYYEGQHETSSLILLAIAALHENTYIYIFKSESNHQIIIMHNQRAAPTNAVLGMDRRPNPSACGSLQATAGDKNLAAEILHRKRTSRLRG